MKQTRTVTVNTTMELDLTEIDWDCYSCCKIEPQGPIFIRGYADFEPIGGKVVADKKDYDFPTWRTAYRLVTKSNSLPNNDCQ